VSRDKLLQRQPLTWDPNDTETITEENFRPQVPVMDQGNVKGLIPKVHRWTARCVIERMNRNIMKWRHKEPEKYEEFFKRTMYGKQINFQSRHLAEPMPYATPMNLEKDDAGPRRRFEREDHFPGDPKYDRRFLRPAKFKKLHLANWEMPSSFTPAVTMKELVDAGVQYGMPTTKFNAEMLKFIYASQDGTSIFDLVQTSAWLNRACYYCMEAASKGATFLFVGTKSQAKATIKAQAVRVGQPYVDERAVGGMFTNMPGVQKAIALMKKLENQKAQGAWDDMNPDDAKKNESAVNRMNRYYNGIRDMMEYPDIVIFVDQWKEKNLIRECELLGIPTVGLIDSNSNPKKVDVPIPGNASGQKSIDLVISKLTDAIQRGQGMRKATSVGDRHEHIPQWDPYIFTTDRWREMNRKNQSQPWMKMEYGNYDLWKAANPYGRIRPLDKFREFSWLD
jgi:small subunit ribosomal protein S2